MVVDHFQTEVPRTCGECPTGEECWEETQDFCPGARAPMPAWAIALIAACIVAAALTIILVDRKRALEEQRKEEEARVEAKQWSYKLSGAAGDAWAKLEKETRPDADSDKWTTSFLSHQKMPAGQTAAHLKTVFDRDMGDNHFLDVEDLPLIDLESLIKAVRSTDVLVLLLTKDVMTRPWCLVEIYTALTHGVPIVPVELDLHSDQSWPATGRARRVKWPTDEELRRICLESGGMARWLECLPTQPPEEVKRFHDALRDKLGSYSRRKYNTQEEEEIRSATEGAIVKRIVASKQDGRRDPVVFQIYAKDTPALQRTKSEPTAQADSIARSTVGGPGPKQELKRSAELQRLVPSSHSTRDPAGSSPKPAQADTQLGPLRTLRGGRKVSTGSPSPVYSADT